MSDNSSKAPVVGSPTKPAPTSSPPSTSIVRDKDYYHSSGDLVFIVEDTLFKVNNTRSINQVIESNIVRDTPLPVGKSMRFTVGR